MQNNSLVRVFGILFALVSIYQLSFTFITSSIEEKAETFSKDQVSEGIPNYLELRDQKAISYLGLLAKILLAISLPSIQILLLFFIIFF